MWIIRRSNVRLAEIQSNFYGITLCLYDTDGECHRQGVLFPKSTFINVQKRKKTREMDNSMPDNERRQKSRFMEERRAK